MKNKGTQFLAEAAVIGAIYVVLTLLFAPLSYGEIQIRFSEALTILPFFTPAAIPGYLWDVSLPISLAVPSCRHYFRKHRNTDRSSIYLQTPQLQPFSCADPADCFQCSHRAIRTSLRIRSKSSDSAYDAYRRYRRSSFLRCSRTDSSDSPSEIQKCDFQITENCITYDI